eukprot:763267-Hanusia_phi.AAC.1
MTGGFNGLFAGVDWGVRLRGPVPLPFKEHYRSGPASELIWLGDWSPQSVLVQWQSPSGGRTPGCLTGPGPPPRVC